jgi:hypothetical protein
VSYCIPSKIKLIFGNTITYMEALQANASMRPLLVIMVVVFIFLLTIQSLSTTHANANGNHSAVVSTILFFVSFSEDLLEETNDETLLDTTAEENAGNFLAQTTKRIIIAYLPMIILIRLTETSITSAKDIMSTIEKNYHIKISSGTVYPILYKLEKEENIKILPHRIKKIYVLTAKGKETLEKLPKKIEFNCSDAIVNIVQEIP